LAAPDGGAGPALSLACRGNGGDVPVSFEFAGGGRESRGEDVAGEGTASVAWEEGDVLLDAGGADDESVVEEGGRHGYDGEGVRVDLEDGESGAGGFADGDEQGMGEGAEVDGAGVGVDLRAGAGDGTDILGLEGRDGGEGVDEGGDIDGPEGGTGVEVERDEGAVPRGEEDGVTRDRGRCADADREGEVAVRCERRDGVGGDGRVGGRPAVVVGVAAPAGPVL